MTENFRYYRKGDMLSYWSKYKIFSPESIEKNGFFHIYKTFDPEEAEIIAVVFMRDVGATMDSTSWDEETGLLFLNYGNTMMPTVNRRVAARTIKRLIRDDDIKKIKKDGLGQLLFAENFFGDY